MDDIIGYMVSVGGRILTEITEPGKSEEDEKKDLLIFTRHAYYRIPDGVTVLQFAGMLDDVFGKEGRHQRTYDEKFLEEWPRATLGPWYGSEDGHTVMLILAHANREVEMSATYEAYNDGVFKKLKSLLYLEVQQRFGVVRGKGKRGK